MILRPSKIFVSFHQLRHYFQQKISELVVSSHPQPPSHTVTQLANFSTTQQSILFFSDINRTLIQKAYSLQQPVKRHSLNEKLLLKVIQRHFPIVKVFSQPTLHGRVWATTHPTQHLRTMMSSSSQSGGGSAFMTWGFPRTAMVGVGRSNNGFAATRQFSTTKAPTCANLFQNTTASQQPNVFTHISSRIFSPAGTKMNQPPTCDEKPKYVPFYSLEKDFSSDDESTCSNSSSSGDYYYYNRIFQQNTNKGMGELVNNAHETCEKRLYVRRESTTTGVRNNMRPATMKKLDSIVRHDDISSLHTTGSSTSTKRKLQHSRQHRKTKHPPQATKSPPDHLHHVKRKEDSTKRKLPHTGGNASNIAVTNVYILITLDTAPFMSTWSTQSLNSSFIDSVETIAHNHQLHLHHVLNLLDRLRYSRKKFRVVARNAELRIYFPANTSIQSECEAIEFLKRINVDQDGNYFTIIVEDQGDYFSLDHHATTTTTPVVGPDYFKDLQMFLDRTDYLIQSSGSAFGSGSSGH